LEKCLEEAAIYQMPSQLRQTFAFICVYYTPANTPHLWQAFREHMSLDFFRHHDNETSYNFALHDIDFILRQKGFSCASFGLPRPTRNVSKTATFNQAEEEAEAERSIAILNPQQLEAFTKIINGIDFPENLKLFYLIGPGGSGKTYLYNTLISFVRGRGELVLAYASTGIAASIWFFEKSCKVRYRSVEK
jgi:PIF1-like helicase